MKKYLDPEHPSNLKLSPLYKAFRHLIAPSSCPFQLLWKKRWDLQKMAPFWGTAWNHSHCTFHPRLWMKQGVVWKKTRRDQHFLVWNHSSPSSWGEQMEEGFPLNFDNLLCELAHPSLRKDLEMLTVIYFDLVMRSCDGRLQGHLKIWYSTENVF